MIKGLKLTFEKFKKNIWDYLNVSLAFSLFTFLFLFIGYLILQDIGVILAFVFLVIPLLMGYKYLIFAAYHQGKVKTKLFKVGFMTYFKSMRIYFSVILKPLFMALISSLVVTFLGSFVVMLYLRFAGIIAFDVVPTREMLIEIISGNEISTLILNITSFVSIVVSIIIFFLTKISRNSIVYLAYEVPLSVENAEATCKKMIKGNYFKVLFSKLLISSLYVFPLVICYVLYKFVLIEPVFLESTAYYVIAAVFFLLSSPIFALKQLNSVATYRRLSKPFEEDFKKEIEKLIKEIDKRKKELEENKE